MLCFVFVAELKCMYLWSFLSNLWLSECKQQRNSLLTQTCSRPETKRVRKALQSYLQSGALSPGCTFDPERDVFLPYDQQKIRKRNAWQCGVCGKHFASEQSVDAHMLRSHPEISSGRDVCLGDFSLWFFQNTTTSLAIEQRSDCLATFAECFPPDQPASSLVFAEAVKSICHLDRTAEISSDLEADQSSVLLLTLLLVVGCLGLFALVLLFLEFGDHLIVSLFGAASLARVLLSARKRLKSHRLID